MDQSALDAKVGGADQWSKARDIANLAVACNGQNQCSDFPGCQSQQCLPNMTSGLAFTGDPATQNPNAYRDYNYCVKEYTEKGNCPATYCHKAQACIPSQNQYPDIIDIKVSGGEDKSGNVILREDNRTVSLTINISANENQLPITMVWIDWGDGSKTGLSGIAWGTGSRNFNHTYAFYPEAVTNKPLGCKDYGNGYECRFRPRVKVVDNWGWCNGQKLQKQDGNHLEKEYAILPTEVFLATGDGLSWGYYGADCFKSEVINRCKKTGEDDGKVCNPAVGQGDCPVGWTCTQISGDDSRYGMQSWDYFAGYINVLAGTDKTTVPDTTPPEINLSFFDINGQRQITQAKLNESIQLNLECKDTESPIAECSVSQGQSPYIDCLPALNNKAKECKTTSCSMWSDCRFTAGEGEWEPILTVIDEKGNKNPNVKPISFTVASAGLKPTVSLMVGATDIGDVAFLSTGIGYTITLTCNNSGADLKYCKLVEDDGSVSKNVCAVNKEIVAPCVGASCGDTFSGCNLNPAGKWKFNLKTEDTAGNQISKPKEITVYSES